MRNSFVKRIGIMVVSASMIAPSVSVVATPLTVYAEDNIGNVSSNMSQITSDQIAESVNEDVIVDTNNGTIVENNGTVRENNGVVDENNGAVWENNQNGTIWENNGEGIHEVVGIGTSTYEGDGVVENNGTIDTNYGDVLQNNGVVEENNGVVEENNGEVSNNEGTVISNNGNVEVNNYFVEYNEESGTVGENNNTVYANRGTVEDNKEDGVIDVNDGTVNENNGTINHNFSTVIDNTNGIIENNYGDNQIGDGTNDETIGTIVNQWWQIIIDNIKDFIISGKDSADDIRQVQVVGEDTEDEDDDIFEYYILDGKSAILTAVDGTKVVVPDVSDYTTYKSIASDTLSWNFKTQQWELKDVNGNIEAVINAEDVATLSETDIKAGVKLYDTYATQVIFNIENKKNPLRSAGTWADMAGIAQKDGYIPYAFSGMTMHLSSSCYDACTGEVLDVPKFVFKTLEGKNLTELGKDRGINVIAQYYKEYNDFGYRTSFVLPDAPKGYGWACAWSDAEKAYVFTPVLLPSNDTHSSSEKSEEAKSEEAAQPSTSDIVSNITSVSIAAVNEVFAAQAVEGSVQYVAMQNAINNNIIAALTYLDNLTGDVLKTAETNGIQLAVGGCQSLDAKTAASLVQTISKVPVNITMSVNGSFISFKIPKGFDMTSFVRADGSIDLIALYRLLLSKGLAK